MHNKYAPLKIFNTIFGNCMSYSVLYFLKLECNGIQNPLEAGTGVCWLCSSENCTNAPASFDENLLHDNDKENKAEEEVIRASGEDDNNDHDCDKKQK